MTLNPVLAREIKERMRSRRAIFILVIFLSLLAGILYLSYRGGIVMLRDSFGGNIFGGASLGRLMFEWLLFFLLLFVSFIAPGVAAGAIVTERERRTMHPLQVTLLSPRSIVLGKLGASLAYVTVLMVSTAPLFAVPLVLGGVTVWQVLRGMIVVGALMLALASLSVYMSAVARRIQFAIVAAYGLCLFLVLGTLVLTGAEALWRSQMGFGAERDSISIYLNPIAALSDAVGNPDVNDTTASPLSLMSNVTNEIQRPGTIQEFGAETEQFIEHRGLIEVEPGIPMKDVPVDVVVNVEPANDGVVQFEPGVRQELAFHNGGPGGGELPWLRMWMIHTGILLVITVLCLAGAAARLRTPVMRFVIIKEKE